MLRFTQLFLKGDTNLIDTIGSSVYYHDSSHNYTNLQSTGHIHRM